VVVAPWRMVGFVDVVGRAGVLKYLACLMSRNGLLALQRVHRGLTYAARELDRELGKDDCPRCGAVHAEDDVVSEDDVDDMLAELDELERVHDNDQVLREMWENEVEPGTPRSEVSGWDGAE